MTRSTVPTIPALSPMYRLQWEAAQRAWVLLYPEGMVRLNEPAAQILRRCDGATAVDRLIDDLQRAYGQVDLRAEVTDFLRTAHEHGWIA
jgi:pyrroloquinoline quinone biosynthesis protein D